jgi:hypothetical protein
MVRKIDRYSAQLTPIKVVPNLIFCLQMTSTGTLFDFTSPVEEQPSLESSVLRIGEDGELSGLGRSGLDHCFVVNSEASNAISLSMRRALGTSSGGGDDDDQYTTIAMNEVAVLRDPISGRELRLHASQPGVQVRP